MPKLHGGDGTREYLESVRTKVSKPATLRVGFLEGATYPDGTPVAMIAAVNEWGRPGHQPPRPFFRRTIAAKQDEWGPATARLLQANNYDLELTFRYVGEGIAGQLREQITLLTDPPLAPSTIRRKGFDKPLIETGHMLNSVDYDVKK